MKSIILAVRFLLELCALGALAYWGFKTQEGTMRWVVGIGAPLVAAVLWSQFVAPGTTAPVAARVVVEVVVFGAAAAALWSLGYRSLAASFVVVVVVNRILDLTLT